MSSKPTLSMNVSGPDTAGIVNATLTYNFPNTPSAFLRPLALWIDGVQHAYNEAQQQSGTWPVTINTNCWFPKTYTFVGYATACRVWNDPDYLTSQTAAVQIGAPPTVDVAISGPNANGQTDASVTYNFPNTDGPSRRHITIWLDGQQIAVYQPGTISGTLPPHPLPTCLASGSHTVNVYATVCQRWNENGYSATDSATFTTTKPHVSLSLRKLGLDAATGRRIIEVTSAYQANQPSAILRVDLLKWVDAKKQSYNGGNLRTISLNPTTDTDVFTFLAPSGARQLALRAQLEGCEVVTDPAAIECDDCDGNASGNPVYYSDGNMRLADFDPLPRIGEWSLTRTYDSDEQVGGLFGRGWTALLDQRVIVQDGYLTVTTESNEAVIFTKIGSIYRQSWPSNKGPSGTMVHDPATATYTYRAAGSTVDAVFNDATGSIMKWRNRATNAEAVVTYDASGRPATFTDSVTGTTWNLTLNAARRVTSIAVAGHPSLVWTYDYDGSENLIAVLAPGSSTWRTYEYASNRMTASRDALGNLIESHTYDANGYAISSTGNIDEIAAIAYDLPGSQPSERITRVTYRNGSQADYTMRPVGGAMRTVGISGGCASCGASEATFVRDQQGRVVRLQGADGYIIRSTYNEDRILMEERALKPAGCNPPRTRSVAGWTRMLWPPRRSKPPARR
ncbi:MAG TPA: DUF6531 domain-containing protein [Thermoanaerobaculia bacterium]|nr:DUF6531 domain-containing protein [Thermoanaerobaculia bacterium]